jgi:hypothetical protein
MVYLVKDVAIYKADQIICLRVPVRVLCYAMEVAILNNCACTYFKHYCAVMYSIVRPLTVYPYIQPCWGGGQTKPEGWTRGGEGSVPHRHS